LDWEQIEQVVEATLEEKHFGKCYLVEEEENKLNFFVENFGASILVEE
jgi:hypothetical protein